MTPDMLYALRDPAGIPSHPIVFLMLGVLTLALHLAENTYINGECIRLDGAIRLAPR